MDFYGQLQKALQSDDIDTKEMLCGELLAYCNTNDPKPKDDFEPIIFEHPSYASFCNIVHPRDLPSRRHFDTKEGLATLVHAITHIEFSAIDLAFDAVYRFVDTPLEYKIDWLIVAEDEIRHFRMLNGILKQLGFSYGDMPVHQGLFDASMHTAGSLLDRMAIIPRHYEATGLDVNPQIVKKLQRYDKDLLTKQIIEAMAVIETEEIDHVRKGDRWFQWACKKEQLDPKVTFKTVLQKYELLRQRPHMNVSARKAAGFACDELLDLGAKSCD